MSFAIFCWFERKTNGNIIESTSKTTKNVKKHEITDESYSYKSLVKVAFVTTMNVIQEIKQNLLISYVGPIQ